MTTLTLIALLSFLSPFRSNAQGFPVASPGQNAGKLMQQRKDLLTELSKAGIAAEAEPIKCSSTARIFAVLRKAEPLPSCPIAKEQHARMLQLEKDLSNMCQGSKARDLLRKFSADDDWYGKMFDLQAEGKDSGELGKLECEIPLTLSYQVRKRLERLANAR